MAGETLPPVVAQLLLDVTDFIAKLDDIKERLSSLASGDHTADVGLDGDATVSEKIDKLDAKLDEYGKKNEKAKVGVDDSGAVDSLKNIYTWAVALAPALDAIGAVGLGSLAVLPGVIGALGLAGGAALGGILPLKSAITDLDTVQTDLQSKSKSTAADLATLNGALAQLAPNARTVVNLFGNQLVPAFQSFERADSQNLFGPAISGLEQLLPLFQDIEPYILDAATGMGKWFTNTMQLLSSQSGLNNINTILHSSLGFLSDLGGAVDRVLSGFLNLGAQGSTLLGDLGQSVDNLAKKFDNWTEDGGSQKFLSYLESALPDVKKFFDELVDVVEQIAKDWAPLGPMWLSSSDMLLKVADAIAKTNPLLIQLIPYVLTLVKGVQALKALSDISWIQNIASGLTGIGSSAEGSVAGVDALKGALSGLAIEAGIAFAAYKAVQDASDNSGKITLGATGNLQTAISEANKSAAGTLFGQNSAAVKQIADQEVAQYNKTHTATYTGPGGGGAAPGGTDAATTAAHDKAAAAAAAAAADTKKTNTEILAADQVAATAETAAAKKTATAVEKAHKAAVTEIAKNVTAAHTAGEKELTTLVSLAHSTNLTTLRTQLNTTHANALKQLEASLKKVYTDDGVKETAQQKSSLEALNTQLVQAHKTALAQLNKELLAQAQANEATALNQSSQIQTDAYNNQATQTADAAQLAADQTSGASAQQIALDQAQEYWDQQIGQAQIAADQAANGTPLQQATANNNLANVQGNAQDALATLSAAVTTSSAAASAATSAATTATTAAVTTGTTSTTTAVTDQTSTLLAPLGTIATDITGVNTSIQSLATAILAIKIPAPEIKVSVKLDSTQIAAAIKTQFLKGARSTGTTLGQYGGGTQTQTATGISNNAVAR